MLKRNKLMKCLSIITILFLLITLYSGCSSAPKGDPKAVMQQYMDSIKNNDIETSYSLLSAESKKVWTKDKMQLHYSLIDEAYPLKAIKIIEKGSSQNERKIDGLSFKNVNEYSVTETCFDNFNKKDLTVTYQDYVINENGEWKIYRGKENADGAISSDYYSIGTMYEAGKGKDKDLIQAAINYNLAIKYNKDYANAYYEIARVYVSLGRYNDALKYASIGVSKNDDSVFRSDTLVLEGMANEGLNKIPEAKTLYKEAVKLNSENEYAKYNLFRLGN